MRYLSLVSDPICVGMEPFRVFELMSRKLRRIQQDTVSGQAGGG